jgi:hypothetical protein
MAAGQVSLAQRVEICGGLGGVHRVVGNIQAEPMN